MKQPKTLSEIRCPDCGSRLEISAAYDGISKDAEKYDVQYSNEWGYLISLECSKCPSVFPLMRTKGFQYISAIARKNER